ncbi:MULTISPECIES: restriction endonuclease [Pedobacter]|uniref:Uncharacterized protein n=2 Tax=Pedobacter TaxID=84567 RepID=A0A369PVD2_9SPHI|nr:MULTISPECIES: restriction endonuclease [Pedobacter]MCZ4224717.1 restriction endonuclease [Pedobacter sp. SJ11]RDC54616.1 hypothetical protein DU508_20560 [Pedobacter chinensis]RZJ89215.1 MAG: hypothetical protein EOO20_11565 [Chryseobacterium sp.]
MPITGEDFEKLVAPFFKKLFQDMGFLVIQVRKQTAGTQNGFDISVLFLDENELEREFFIECKYYASAKLEWSEIFSKQVQLDSSNHDATAFIALSPLKNLSNIDHNIQAKQTKAFKFPVDFWTPDKDVEKMFALDKKLYQKIYDEPCLLVLDEEKELQRLKVLVNLLISKKDLLRHANLIKIPDATSPINGDEEMVTSLDIKLNAICKSDDQYRIIYHKARADYKVYLESLVDVHSELRTNILNWEENMRLKASRLTHNFKMDDSYTPQKFFSDFFNEAEKEILTFYGENELKGDKEKLLCGIVFELAAQCPLDWRKNGTD